MSWISAGGVTALRGVGGPELRRHRPRAESLKRTLIYMDAAEITTEQTHTLAEQISAIRLQLRRLLADQQALGAEIERRALGR